jgi:hypothetical protein
MPTIVTIDGGRTSTPLVEPDAHGQAALLLTESLIHALVENAALSNADAVGVIRTAAEVKVEVAEAADESKARMNQSLALLYRMAESFQVDPT